ncbi:MAG: tetratricopeptide repeat protein [Prevotella sp.]|nr:tetratricopeptide repeat protein [Prevotella sp.]
MIKSDNATERIRKQLADGNVGLAIAEMEIFLMAWPQPQTAERLRALKEEYTLMGDYWMSGFDDPQRQQLYQRLLQKAYVVYANVAIHRHMKASSFLTGLYQRTRTAGREWSVAAIRREMEDYVSDVAMLELEPEEGREAKSQAIHKEHKQQMAALFDYVLTSRMWTDSVGRDFTELLLSPTVDSNDQQLLVAAVMLAAMCQFDMVKLRLLFDVYQQSVDEHVRQRALVGWVFAMEPGWHNVYPEQRATIERLAGQEAVRKELTELQIQLLYTLNAEKDTDTIKQEIMPDLLKNNSFRITRNGIEETEDDPLEDVLHPDAAEQRMEKVESSFRRMMDMQKKGADIYFGGFSQMKRFPFFYDTANWLMPFYMQHPDIAQFTKTVGSNKFLKALLTKGTFCNSDKYSLVIAFQQVMDRLPKSLLQMMERGEAAIDEMEMAGSDADQQTPAYIRRIYLMDLYRLFRLFPNRSAMPNPFDMSQGNDCGVGFMASPLLEDTPADDCKHEVIRAMKRMGCEGPLMDRLLASVPQRLWDVQYFLWSGNYEAALTRDPNNERALAERARHSFDYGEYEEAADDYEHLMLINPKKTGYMLNKAVCLMKMEEYDDALQLLYQLNYEHADDINVQRVLAWTLTSDNKLEQADRIYQQLMAQEKPSGEDYQNYAYCLWLQGRLSEAAENLGKYFDAEGESYEAVYAAFDENWLKAHSISDIDIKMMKAMVMGQDIQKFDSTSGLPF